jgi:X-Pro dipeptidyl-peptidase
MKSNQDRLTGDYNQFWAGRDYLNQIGPMKAALFMSHGFNDWNVMPEHSYRIYRAARDKGLPCRIYYHQGGHGGPPPLEMMNRWFTRYLYGVENGVENEPRSYIVREGDKPSQPTPYEDYPHPDARAVRLHLAGDGRQIGRLGSSIVPNQDSSTLVDDVSFPPRDLAKAASSEHRLLFATEPLAEPLHISGMPRLSIKLACNKLAANLSVMLVALPVPENGKITDYLINRGWADPQNYRSLTESEPLVPGQFYELSFDLQPDDQVIPAGKQLGLMIFSSDRDHTLWPPAGTELTVKLDSTAVDLPVVGGIEAWTRSTAK